MGITIHLTTERGDILDQADDPTNHMHRFLPETDDPEYVLVNYIDWYGYTVFNRLQMPRFITEWVKLHDAAVVDGATDLHA